MADIDQVLQAQRAGQPTPADQRQWIVIEVLSGRVNWTVHNLPLDEAFKLLQFAALDARDLFIARERGGAR